MVATTTTPAASSSRSELQGSSQQGSSHQLAAAAETAVMSSWDFLYLYIVYISSFACCDQACCATAVWGLQTRFSALLADEYQPRGIVHQAGMLAAGGGPVRAC